MRTAKHFIYSLILFSFVFLAACSTTSDPADSYPGQSGQQIFQGGEDALRDKSYAEAIKRYEALDAQYPFDPNTQTAQLHIIYAYYMNGDYPSAEAAADRFIHLHPTSPHDDYAYYMRGLSNYYQNMGVFERLFAVDFATRDLTQIKKSYTDFATLERNYPSSAYAPAAHQYMIYLRDVLANHQLEVGQYYFSRRAYVASANRASLVVEHYQGAPVVPDALVMMARSYYQLHLGEQLNQTIQVIQYNYPNTRYAEEVSGHELGSTSFAVVSPKNIYVAPKAVAQTPPAMNYTSAANTPQIQPQNPSVVTANATPQSTVAPAVANTAEHMNGGERGSTTPIGKLVNSFKSWKKTVTPASPAQTASAAPVPVQTANAAGTPSSVIQPSDVQNQIQQEQLQQAQAEAPVVKSPDGGTMTPLGGVWDKIKNSEFFALHSKTDKTSQPQVAQAGQTPAASAQTDTPAATPQPAPATVADAAPYHASPENGARS